MVSCVMGGAFLCLDKFDLVCFHMIFSCDCICRALYWGLFSLGRIGNRDFILVPYWIVDFAQVNWGGFQSLDPEIEICRLRVSLFFLSLVWGHPWL